ncbi:hypothetical protein G6F68_012414 [Rhizopus microsporus]|nr:hypothetical protein G6F68_012414 [Rhizopus microsporus]
MLHGLGDKVRRAFLMSQLEGASYADSAAKLGVTVSSVKKYMARATEHCLVYALERHAADVAAHGRWLAADPEHARIWRQVERLRGTLGAAPARLAADTLYRADHHFTRRRAVLRNGLGAVALLGAGGLVAWRTLPVERMAASYLADYRMGTGERRELVLTDGTLLWLDSASAVDVAVDARGRHITVHAGEILIDTEHAAQGLPPLRVTTLQGTVRPLGTRFTVNRQDTQTRAAAGAECGRTGRAGRGGRPP